MLHDECSESEPCDVVSGLVCEDGICLCDSESYSEDDECCEYFWNKYHSRGIIYYLKSSHIVEKKSFNDACTSDIPCNDARNLTCIGGLCKCPSGLYFESNKNINKCSKLFHRIFRIEFDDLDCHKMLHFSSETQELCRVMQCTWRVQSICWPFLLEQRMPMLCVECLWRTQMRWVTCIW